MNVITLPCGPLSANMYLVYDAHTSEALVIDPADASVLRDTLKGTSLSVKGIFCTHAHFDHTAALQKIRELTKAPTYIHADDHALLRDPCANASAMIYSPRDLGQCDVLLHDGDEVNIGSFSLCVLHTPGHTPGSSCLMLDTCIFSGDTVFSGGIGRTDLPGGNFDFMVASLKKIRALDGASVFYPGHGPSSDADAMRCYLASLSL